MDTTNGWPAQHFCVAFRKPLCLLRGSLSFLLALLAFLRLRSLKAWGQALPVLVYHTFIPHTHHTAGIIPKTEQKIIALPPGAFLVVQLMCSSLLLFCSFFTRRCCCSSKHSVTLTLPLHSKPIPRAHCRSMSPVSACVPPRARACASLGLQCSDPAAHGTQGRLLLLDFVKCLPPLIPTAHTHSYTGLPAARRVHCKNRRERMKCRNARKQKQ